MKTNVRKKLCAAALSVLMLTGTAAAEVGTVAVTSMPAYAAVYETPASSFSYYISNGKEVHITKYNGSDANVVIPAYIEGKPVVKLVSSSFFGNTTLESVTIPETVTDIDGVVFKDCVNLKTVNATDNIQSIGISAFANTAWYLNQPNGGVYLGKIYYRYKSVMPENTSVVIRDGTIGIAECAFYGQTGLVSVVLPEGLYSIDSWAFENCSELRSIYMPPSVKHFGYEAFKGCSDITVYGEAGSSAEFFANNYKYKFSTEPMVAENVSTVSASVVDVGSSVTVNCAAVGGAGSYTFGVLYRKVGSKSWTTAQSYKENAAVNITPKSAADYEIRVIAKSSDGKLLRKDFALKVNRLPVNTSKLGAASVKLGEKVKVRCFAKYGTEPYQYAVYYKKSSSKTWSKLRDYGTGNIVMLTPKSAVDYDVRVDIKDACGNVTSKTLALKVTK